MRDDNSFVVETKDGFTLKIETPEKGTMYFPLYRDVDPDDREECRAFAEGWNAALDEIDKLNRIQK